MALVLVILVPIFVVFTMALVSDILVPIFVVPWFHVSCFRVPRVLFSYGFKFSSEIAPQKSISWTRKGLIQTGVGPNLYFLSEMLEWLASL